jgi:hypothetical protein
MADLTLQQAQTARDNLASYDDLQRKMLSLESQTIAWMAEATSLHGAVLVEDQATILALRNDLVARLTAAVAI